MKLRALALSCGVLVYTASAVAAQQTLQGRAVSLETRVPVTGAMIVDVATGRHAITGADGRFALMVAGPTRVRVEHIGYVTVSRLVDPADEVVLRLERNVTEVDALVVTASRRLQKLADAPVTTELITRAEIDETGGSSAAAVILERTGIALEGGHPVGSSAMLQGFEAERVLVLLDGQPLTGRMSGSFDLTRIPAGMLERIEVIKGPQSTLFGSDAVGGVINLITRYSAGPAGGSAEVISGTQGRLDLSGRVHGSVGKLSVLADGGRRQIEVTPGLSSESGAHSQQWDALLKARYDASAHVALELSGLVVDEKQRWQSGQLYNFADNLQLGGRLSAPLSLGTHRLTPTLYTSEFRHTPARSSTDEITVPGNTETQRLVEAELLHSYVRGRFAVDNGVELRDELLRSTNIAGGTRSLNGMDAYSQITVDAGALDIVPGVRLSTSEVWGTHWTPRLALLYRRSASVALRASVGTAYRAPAFKELFMSFLNTGAGAGYVVRGNQDLRPESSENISLGVELTRPRYYARAQVFYNRFDDFIETQVVGDSAGFTVFSYGNIEDGLTRGAELELNTTWKGARLEAGYSYLDARDRATDQQLLGRPRHSARAHAGYTFAFGTRVGVTSMYTGATPLQRSGTELRRRAAYTRVDGRVAHTLMQTLELSLGVNNLFDRRPADWPGYTGRQLYIGVAWRPMNLQEGIQ